MSSVVLVYPIYWGLVVNIIGREPSVAVLAVQCGAVQSNAMQCIQLSRVHCSVVKQSTVQIILCLTAFSEHLLNMYFIIKVLGTVHSQ